MPVSNMASSRSKENVNLRHFQHLMMSQCWCVLHFFLGHFYLVYLADVIASVCLANIVLSSVNEANNEMKMHYQSNLFHI